ncbi:MAG: hypothetical protein AAF649_02115 [Verrucomicrobiota bacterium]
MNFLDIPDRINQLLYKKDLFRLNRHDIFTAKEWTKRLIRDSHPHWTEQQVEEDYQKLSKIKVVAVDQWEKRNLGSK